ncbi:MAG: hypothetical protein QG656_14, partial [Candidatus Hydrogenedentes bacterium]|nr:hypothetical protein [Candidatus Hydrogenedentota bacterium]
MKKGRCASPNDSTVVCAMLEHCETVSRWWMGLRNRAGQEGHTHRRILVADDEATSLNAMVRVIESRLKCHVTSAPSGDEALRLLNEGLFDVLVTDMVMPGIHGLELVSAVRAKWPDLAIVVTTGFPDDFPYVEVVHAGANDFIAKPHQAAELEAKLVRILNEKDTRDAQMLAELKYRSLFELSMNGMLILEPVNYKILDCNQAFCELSERSKDALMDATLFDLLDPFEKGRFEQCMALFAA